MYSTPAERRDAGTKHPLGEYVTVTAFAEFEYIGERFRLTETSSRVRDNNFGLTLQAGLVAKPVPWLALEVVYEFAKDRQTHRHGFEEAIAKATFERFDVEAGTLFLPFGVFFNRFATAPLLEFGETRARGAVLSYDSDRGSNVGAFTYKVDSDVRANGRNLGWGLAMEAVASPALRVGASYLSSLAYAPQGTPACTAPDPCRRVGAVSAFAVIGNDEIEVTAEILTALRSYTNPGQAGTRPRAWNVEVALFPVNEVSLAFRVEGSTDLTGAPGHRAGAAFSWRAARNVSFTVDYLHGRGNIEDPEGAAADRSNRIGAQLNIGF